MDSAKADYLAALIIGSANLPLGMIYICFLSRTEVSKIRLRCWNMIVNNQFQNLNLAQNIHYTYCNDNISIVNNVLIFYNTYIHSIIFLTFCPHNFLFNISTLLALECKLQIIQIQLNKTGTQKALETRMSQNQSSVLPLLTT